MDASDLSCSICEEPFSNDRVPRSLACGHSFCHECLGEILSVDRKCPECRRVIAAPRTDEIPCNYALLRLVRTHNEAQLCRETEQLAVAPGSFVIAKIEQEGEKCKEHDSVLFFICTKCNVFVCRDCLVLDHPDPPRGNCRIISAKEAYNNMKNSSRETLAKCVNEIKHLDESQLWETTYLKSKAQHFNEKIQDLERELRKAKVYARQLEPRQQKLETRKSTLREMKDMLVNSQGMLNRANTNTEIKDAMKVAHENQAAFEKFASQERQGNVLCPTDKQNLLWIVQRTTCVYASLVDNGKERWSPVTFKEGQILLYSLRDGIPPTNGTIISYEHVRKMVTQDSPLIFMEIGWDGLIRGLVYTKMFGDTPRSRQAVFLCSGEKGPSYRNTAFYKYEYMENGPFNIISGGDYENNNGSGGRAIVGNLTDGIPYMKTVTAGLMVSWPVNDHWRLGSFEFYLNNVPQCIDYSAYGQVSKGLEILFEAAKVDPISKTSVMDCGLVIHI